MSKILTVGFSETGLNRIEDQLTPLKKEMSHLTIRRASNGAIAKSLKDKPDVLIYDAIELKPMMNLLVKVIRDSGFSGYIIITTVIPMGLYPNEIQKYNKVFILEKPYLRMQIQGLVRKCLSSHEIQQQRHKRYEVHMPSVLECYTRDLKIKTVLNNISTKGAGVEGHFGPLSRGDIVKLHLRFENSKKERIVSTRVQWIKRTAYGTEAAGLEFISDKVLYQYLLGQAIIS